MNKNEHKLLFNFLTTLINTKSDNKDILSRLIYKS